MSEEDDWFERALRDLDEESDSSAAAGNDAADGDATDRDAEESGETAEDIEDTEATERDERVGSREGEVGAPDPDETDGTDGTDGTDAKAGDGTHAGDGRNENDPFGGIRGTPSESTEGGDGGEEGGGDSDDDRFGSGSFGDTDPFGGTSGNGDETDPFSVEGSPDGDSPDDAAFDEDSFGTTDPMANAGDGGGGFGDAGPDSFDDAEGDQFGDDGSDPFGGGGSGDPFGGYRETSSSSSDDFGFSDLDGGQGGAGDEPTEFDVDPDEFESSIERTDVGIEGLDEMILGGVPRRSLLSVIGGAGTGKTTFALQFLNEALESGDKGVYITLEQTRESIFSTAEEKGWSFREHAAEDRLAIVAIDPIEMANSLASIRNDLTRLIAEFDADRLVLDSVSLLEMMYDHPAKRRSEVFGFTRSLKDAGLTTLLTSEASETNPYASRHGIVEYLTDAVFVLQYIRGSDFRETRLAVEIQKIRDANHSRETKPYEITDTGISVYGQANIF